MLTPEQASEFYAEHFGKPFFPGLVAYMSSGPVMALVLAHETAIDRWRELIGPTDSSRARSTHPDRQAFIGTLQHRLTYLVKFFGPPLNYISLAIFL